LSVDWVVVGCAVVLVVVVVVAVGFVVVVVVVVADDGAAAVVVVVSGAVVVVVVGATKGEVSPLSEAWLTVGAAERFVQLCAAFQLWRAAVAGVPVSGWGSPDTMVAGRQVAETM
jgi:hypothetical protein